jgi:ERCC4-type nuclease
MAPAATVDRVTLPFTILVDQQEKLPFGFRGLNSDARDGRRELVVPTKAVRLVTGDYSIEGFESRVACERKNASDLFCSLGRGRARFQRELVRLNAMDFAAVVIEADWDEIINRPPERSRLRPKVVFRTVIAWQQRYPRVHWWACPDRRFAEVTVLRVLERFWRDHQ